ncbi:MAG: isochorismatase family protein [Gammaproteobacteria bacterium]
MSLVNVEQSQLVIIDVQDKLGAAMPSKVINRVINNTTLLLRVAGLLNVPVVVTEQYPAGLGATIADVAATIPATAVRLEKTSFSATGCEPFNAQVRTNTRSQVIIAGMEAHVCVLQTAVRLREAGYEPLVVEDAICSRKLENYQNALERIRQNSITIVSTESIVFEWLADKNNPQFRAVSGLLR